MPKELLKRSPYLGKRHKSGLPGAGALNAELLVRMGRLMCFIDDPQERLADAVLPTRQVREVIKLLGCLQV